MTYEKKLWTYGNEFYDPDTKEMYSGYVGISEGKAYKFYSDEALNSIHTFLSAFDLSENKFDRLLNDDLELPYSLNQVEFAPNDFLNKHTLHSILKRLELNNQYLFKCSTISSPKIPNYDNNFSYFTPTFSDNDERFERIASPTRLKKSTIKKLPTSFFPSTEIEANFDIFDVQQSLIKILNVSTIKDLADSPTYMKVLVILLFKDKIVFCRTLHNVNDNQVNDIENISFNNEKRLDTLVLKTTDPRNKNTVSFKHLNSMFLDNNILYVSDYELNTVYKYDVSHIIQSERSTQWNTKNITLIDSIQGSNIIKNKLFNKPCGIAATNDYLYIGDNGNSVVKKYTKNLDYISSIKSNRFIDQTIDAMASNENKVVLSDGTIIDENSVWVISSSTNYMYITIISDDKSVYQKQISSISLLDKYWDEEVKNIQFSKSNSNYFYIHTNRRIIKFHTSKPNKPFAFFSFQKEEKGEVDIFWKTTDTEWNSTNYVWNKNSDADSSDNRNLLLKCFSVDSYDKKINQTNGDFMFIIGLRFNEDNLSTLLSENSLPLESQEHGDLTSCLSTIYIFFTSQPHEYLSLLADKNFPCYDPSDTTEIEDDEYINFITINKCLYKLSYNLIQFKNLLKGRFWSYYNQNNVIDFDRIVLDDAFQQLSIFNDDKTEDINFFIQANESNSILINRVFKCIWEIQNKILNLMKSEIKDVPYSYLTKPIIIE